MMKTKIVHVLPFYVLLCPMGYVQPHKFGDIEAFELKNSVWRSGEISVCWENPSPEDANLRNTVRYAI